MKYFLIQTYLDNSLHQQLLRYHQLNCGRMSSATTMSLPTHQIDSVVICPNQFTCFPDLPVELQLIIWSLCPVAAEKQVIKIADTSKQEFCRSLSIPETPTSTIQSFSEILPNENFISVKYTTPPLLQVCKSSRELALAHYRRVPTTFGDTKEGSSPFYINADKDSVLIETEYQHKSANPGLDFWILNGQTFSTVDGKRFCTSVARRWTGSDRPTLEDVIYLISRFPEIEHLYFLDCPYGPPNQTFSRIRNVQWWDRGRVEDTVKNNTLFYHNLMMNPTVAAVGADRTDILNHRGIFRDGWQIPMISYITSEEFNKLQCLEEKSYSGRSSLAHYTPNCY